MASFTMQRLLVTLKGNSEDWQPRLDGLKDLQAMIEAGDESLIAAETLLALYVPLKDQVC